jgi:hypothetical protein
MKIYVYPADQFGCGHYRLIYPARVLQAQGHDITIVNPNQRNISITHTNGKIQHVTYPQDADVMVFQRVTHHDLVPTLAWLRARGVTIVTDIDDDLSAMHPNNAAWGSYHPKSTTHHSWNNIGKASQIASLTTVSTPALLDRYANGKGIVLPNCIPAAAFSIERHANPQTIGWPGSLHSHPNDPQSVGGALRRLLSEGATFRMVGNQSGCGAAFGIGADPWGTGPVAFGRWLEAIANYIGIGIAPLADTKFNEAKSWLKVLELSALGIPWIASDLPEYQKFAQQAKLPHWMLARKPQQWYRGLKTLWDPINKSTRRALADQAQQHAANWTVERNAWKWAEAWTSAREQDLQKDPARSVKL